MKLFCSSRSPYARLVMVMANEAGLADRIERVLVIVSPYRLESRLLPYNPLMRIPTLVRDDGRALLDSRAICEYLDGLAAEPVSYPASGDRLAIDQAFAIGDGLMDLGTRWVAERMRNAQKTPEDFLDAARTKFHATLDMIERDLPEIESGGVHLGSAAIACALAYFDFRHDDEPWRERHAPLAGWFEQFAARPSMRATVFLDQ